MKPDIAVIIPVLNETATINAVLDCLAYQSKGKVIETVVVDAGPEAMTLKAIEPEKSPRLLLKTERADRGRGIQMNRGAELAEAAVLLFLHADTLLPADALDSVLATMRNKHLVGGAFDLGIRSNRWGYRVIESVAAIRSRLTRLPYGDQAIFLRKDYFHSMGGYSEIPIMEDVDIMRRIKKNGDAIKIIGRRVRTDPRRWEKEGMLYGTLRNWLLMTLYLAGVSPHKLARYYK